MGLLKTNCPKWNKLHIGEAGAEIWARCKRVSFISITMKLVHHAQPVPIYWWPTVCTSEGSESRNVMQNQKNISWHLKFWHIRMINPSNSCWKIKIKIKQKKKKAFCCTFCCEWCRETILVSEYLTKMYQPHTATWEATAVKLQVTFIEVAPLVSEKTSCIIKPPVIW